MAGGAAYNAAQAANKAIIESTLAKNQTNVTQQSTPIVQPVDPSGYGYAHGSTSPNYNEQKAAVKTPTTKESSSTMYETRDQGVASFEAKPVSDIFGLSGLVDVNAQKGSEKVYQSIKAPEKVLATPKDLSDLVNKRVEQAQQQYLQKKEESFNLYQKSRVEFSDWLEKNKTPGTTFEIEDKNGKVVATTSGDRSFHDITAARIKYGNVTVNAVNTSQENATPFSVRESLTSLGISLPTSLTSGTLGFNLEKFSETLGLNKGVGKTENLSLGIGLSIPIPTEFLTETVKSAASFILSGGKELVATAPIIAKDIYGFITTGKQEYNIPKTSITSPLSGLAESILNPSAGFSEKQKEEYKSNSGNIDKVISSVRAISQSYGVMIPHGITKANTSGAGVGT